MDFQIRHKGMVRELTKVGHPSTYWHASPAARARWIDEGIGMRIAASPA